MADAEPSIDESNRPIKNHSHLHESRRSARNLRKARQSRGGRVRVERAGPTHAARPRLPPRVHVLANASVSPLREKKASAPSRRSSPARLTPPPPAKWYIRRGKRTTQRPCGPRRSRCCARRPCSSARPAARCAPRVSVPPRASPATVPRRDALAMDTPRRAMRADVSAKKPAASSFPPCVFLSPPPRRVRSTRPTRPSSPPPDPPSQAAKAGNEYAEGAAASFEALPKRIRNLRKKATRESAGVKLYAPQKGWPRGYEFGSHRMRRKLRPSDWDAALQASWHAPGDKGELAW